MKKEKIIIKFLKSSDKFRKAPKVYNRSDARKSNYIRLTKKELYNILLYVFEKDEIISMQGGFCLWGLPYKVSNGIIGLFVINLLKV